MYSKRIPRQLLPWHQGGATVIEAAIVRKGLDADLASPVVNIVDPLLHLGIERYIRREVEYHYAIRQEIEDGNVGAEREVAQILAIDYLTLIAEKACIYGDLELYKLVHRPSLYIRPITNHILCACRYDHLEIIIYIVDYIRDFLHNHRPGFNMTPHLIQLDTIQCCILSDGGPRTNTWLHSLVGTRRLIPGVLVQLCDLKSVCLARGSVDNIKLLFGEDYQFTQKEIRAASSVRVGAADRDRIAYVTERQIDELGFM